MAQLVFATAALLAILHYDIKPKLNGEKKVLWISLSFLLAGYGILVLHCFGIDLPSPMKPIQQLIKAIFPAV